MFQIYSVSIQQKAIYLKCCISFMIDNSVCLGTSFYTFFVYFWSDSPHWSRVSSFTRFLDNTQRRVTFGRTPLPDNTQHSQKTNIYDPGKIFESTNSAGERPQTRALDRSATGTGFFSCTVHKICWSSRNMKWARIWMEKVVAYYKTISE